MTTIQVEIYLERNISNTYGFFRVIDNVHGEPTIEGYQYRTGLKRAFESLISERYRSSILTVGFIAVSINHCADNGHLGVFDSHVRDVYGKSHARGTCTKYDVAISNNVREVLKRSSGQHMCYKDHCFAVVLYSICYLIISPCSYWNSNTLDAIIESGSQLNNTLHSKHCLTSVTLPDSVTIFGTKINVHVNEVSHGEISNLTESRISLETLIFKEPHWENRLFNVDLKLLYSLYLSTNTKVKQFFSLLTYKDSHSPAMIQTKHICGVNNLVEEINNIILKQKGMSDYGIRYRIYLLFV